MDSFARSHLASLGIFCGIAAPILYAAIVIWGANRVPGYSHLGDPISSLVESGRIGRDAVQRLFGIYNLLEMAFALTGLALVRRPRIWSLAFGSLLLTAVLGLLMWPFAMDPMGTPATPAGVIHMVLAGISSLATMAAMLFTALAWGTTRIGRAPAALSAATLAIVCFSGLLAAAAAAGGWPLLGLFERITIGSFMVWQLAMATIFFVRHHHDPHFLEPNQLTR
jgi:hypothetical protein